MKRIKVLGRTVVESIEENIYEIEIPDSLSVEETEIFVLKNRDRLEFVENRTKKKAAEGEIHVKKILEDNQAPVLSEGGGEPERDPSEAFVDTSKIKETLNQLIIREEFERFKERFPKDKVSLRSAEIYLLLHNSLNSQQFELAAFILDEAHKLLKEEHIFKVLEGVGVVDSPVIIWKYIELGYDGRSINGRGIKEIYRSRGVEWKTTF